MLAHPQFLLRTRHPFRSFLQANQEANQDATPGGGNTGAICFTGDSLLTLENGSTKKFRDLQVRGRLRVFIVPPTCEHLKGARSRSSYISRSAT